MYIERDTLAIESSAWNLNVIFMSLSKKQVREYNRPYIKPLDPMEIKKYHVVCLKEIWKDLSSYITTNIDYVYCRGPGLAPSLDSTRILKNIISSKRIVKYYPIFHGISHLAEVLIKDKEETSFLFTYLSGGSTQFILKEIDKPFKILSETLDITAGNLIDRKLSSSPYCCKSFEKEPSLELILSELEKTKRFVSNFSPYFNLSGIEILSKNWSYEKLLSLIANLILRNIQLSKEKKIFFGGGVFNCKELKQALIKNKPSEVSFYFEENNSDKAYMHILSKYLYKIPSRKSYLNYNIVCKC